MMWCVFATIVTAFAMSAAFGMLVGWVMRRIS